MRGAQRWFETRARVRRATRRLKPPRISASGLAQFWYRAEVNVGDVLAAPIAEHLFGLRSEWVRPTFEGKLLGLGSIARHLRDHDVVAGAGAIRDDPIRLPPSARVSWVRGPLTRRCLGEKGVPEVYGDPGLLVAELLPAPTATATGPIGVVPHLCDEPRRSAAARIEGVTVLDVRDEPTSFLEGLAGCSAVLSSSLHGLIFAEAYGIPALWLEPHPDMKGGRFKFDDYYLGTGREPPAPLSLDAAMEIAGADEAVATTIDVGPMKTAAARLRAEIGAGEPVP